LLLAGCGAAPIKDSWGVQTLVDAGVLTESSGKKRDRNLTYAAYLDVMKTGTDL